MIKPSPLALGLVLGLAVAPAGGAPASATEIKIFSSRAVATVLDVVGPQFERETGNKLDVVVGVSPDFMKWIAGGQPFDIIFSPPRNIEALIKSGKVQAGSRVDLVRSGLGVEVKAGAPKPDIGTVDALKRALTNAKSVAYLASGGVGELIQRLELTDVVKPKATTPNSDIVSELVAKGDVELGLVVMTQIMTTPGVELAGPLPPEIQVYTVFSSGISASSPNADAARNLIKFLQGPAAAPVIKAQGMEPA